MSEVSMQADLDRIIAKGTAGKIIPSEYTADTLPLYTRELALYNAYKTAMNEVKTKFGSLPDIVAKASALKDKKANAKTNKDFTADDQAQLDAAEASKLSIMAAIDSVTATNAAEAQKISDDLRTAQLAAIKPTGKPGQLDYIQPNNLAEFIVRTQALNPYSRQRECDTRMLKLVLLSAEKTATTAAALKALKALISERILNA